MPNYIEQLLLRLGFTVHSNSAECSSYVYYSENIVHFIHYNNLTSTYRFQGWRKGYDYAFYDAQEGYDYAFYDTQELQLFAPAVETFVTAFLNNHK
jgi:hypothetical protein